MAGPVHYEIYVRRKPGAPWTLDCALEDRSRLSDLADQLLADGRAVGVRASKETFDVTTGRFDSVTLFSRGDVEMRTRSKTPTDDQGPLCITPQDLYSAHARERIVRLMGGWLKRKAVTAFELLHRADLVEQLEASGVEIQHALQKIAIPEAQARGLSVHEVIRQLQGLVDRAMARVMKDGRAKSFPTLTAQTFAAEAERLAEHPERLYILSGGVAHFLADANGWLDKAERLITLAEHAPEGGRARALALAAVEPPMSEILGQAGGLNDLFGADLDLGASLAALTTLAAPREAAMIRRMDAGVAKALPPLPPVAQRLAALIEHEAFEGVRAAIGKRVLAELNSPRRLRPDDAEGEIVLLRALAMVLTASAGRLLQLEDVQTAFVDRSKRLVAADFVTAFVAELAPSEAGALQEARALVRLSENVVGVMNKKAACRWLTGALEALRFEKDVRSTQQSPTARLAALADLHRALGAAGLPGPELRPLQQRISDAGGWVERDSHLCTLVVASGAALPARANVLARLALGETAPPGPAADRARAELAKLLRDPASRAELTDRPEVAARVRDALTPKAPPVAAAA
ncbi:hypothetical protein BH09PSE2_BH09PSE2_04790 [soil metagenome]